MKLSRPKQRRRPWAFRDKPLRLERLEDRTLLSADPLALSSPVDRLTLIASNVTIQSDPVLPVDGFIDLAFAVPDGADVEYLAAYDAFLSLDPTASGVTFTGAAEAPSAVFPGQVPFVYSTLPGDQLWLMDYLAVGQNPILDGAGLFRAEFQVAPGTTGAFDLVFLEVNLVRGDASSIPNVDLVGGTITVEIAPLAGIHAVLRGAATAFDDQDTGEVNALPASEPWIHEWDPFWVEIWVETLGSDDVGVTRASATLSYNSDYLHAETIQYGPAFTVNQTGQIDNNAGEVTQIGATTIRTDVGDDRFALLARVRFTPDATVDVPVDVAGQYAGPYYPDLGLTDVEVELVGPTSATPNVGPLPQTELWAVIYDYDDNGKIDLGDLAAFAPVFLQEVDGNPDPDAWWADFNKSGTIDFGDLAELAPNFLQQRPNEHIEFPVNFPDAWRLAGLALELPPTPQAPDTSSDELVRVYGYEQLVAHQRRSNQRDTKEAIDVLLAGYWP